MPLGTFTDFFVQSGGNNMNGGSDANNAAAFTSTNGNWDGTSVFTPTDGSTPASTVSAGQFASVYNDGTTGTPVYIARVVSVAAGVNGAITLSTTAKAGAAPTSSATARSIKVGGAWAGPSGSITFPLNPLTGMPNLTDAAGDLPRINFKCSGTGAIDAAMTATTSSTTVGGPIVFQGYKTTVGDGETNTDTQANQVNYKYRVDGSTNAIVLHAMGTAVYIADFQFSNNGTTGSNAGVNLGAAAICERVVVHDVRGNGFAIVNGNCQLLECEAYACNGSNTASLGGVAWASGNAGVVIDRCSIHHNTGSNVNGLVSTGSSNNGIAILNSLIHDNGLYGVFEQSANNSTLRIEQSDIYNNAADGVRLNRGGTGGWVHIENCNFENNGQSSGTGYAINRADTKAYRGVLQSNRYYNNKTGTTNSLGPIDENNSITGTGTSYNAPTTGDFRLLGTDAGTAKNAGRGTFTQTKASVLGTVGFPDVAAAQHQDTGGSAGMLYVPPGMSE